MSHFKSVEIDENASDLTQGYQMMKRDKNMKANAKYKMALDFLVDRTIVPPIEMPYSIVFHVDSVGICEYFPKKDRLHIRRTSTWLNNGLTEIKKLFERWKI